MEWNKLYIHPSQETTDDDIRDFIEWVSRKAERLGFRAEVERYQKTESGSTDTVSVNPLKNPDETH
jgi:hypothetical protein